jgi:Ricin-type beta-trefoil lectin domain-like
MRSHHFVCFFTLGALGSGCSAEATDTSTSEAALTPVPGATVAAQATSATVPAPATARSREAWRKAMSKTPVPKEGCFKVSHPSMTWVEVPCTTAPNVPYGPARGIGAQAVGNSTGFVTTASNTISSAEGTFSSVTGVTSASSSDYSLQLNSNPFISSSHCAGAANPSACRGWQQFVYSAGSGVIFMQYWLLNYGNTCPSGWSTSGGDCYQNSSATAVPYNPLSALATLSLTGDAGSTDEIVMFDQDNLYTSSRASVLGLNAGWTNAEFNVYGDGNLSQVDFNAGSSVVVQISIQGGAPSTTCASGGYTGETNNLTLVADSCCPGGYDSVPGIQFKESNVAGATPEACPASTYSVVNRNTAAFGPMCLNVSGASTTENAAIIQWTCGGAPIGTNEQFVQRAVGNGTFMLQAVNSGMCVTVQGEAMVQDPCNEGTNQQFVAQPTSGGYGNFVVQSSGLCLTVSGTYPQSTFSGQAIVQETCSAPGTGNDAEQQQQFLLHPYNYTAVVNRNNATFGNMCLNVSGGSFVENASIVQWTCGSEPTATNMEFSPVFSGSEFFLETFSFFVAPSNGFPLAGLILTDNPAWYTFEPTSGGFGYIVAESSGMCLTVSGTYPQSNFSGQAIIMETCGSDDANYQQEFMLEQQ